MRKHIPNIITLLNLLSGCIAVVCAFQGAFRAVVLFVLMAALFDFLDGMAARLLHAYSDIGKELDSLSDLVSFGVAPASALFVLLRDYSLIPVFLTPFRTVLPFLAFLIPLFSALRLAKFNLDERQTTSFLGLPTPANGLLWVSYCYSIHTVSSSHKYIFYVSIVFIFILSLLMISEIPMFSLKIKKISFKGYERQWITILLTIAFVILFGITGIACAILFYILLSMITCRNHNKSA